MTTLTLTWMVTFLIKGSIFFVAGSAVAIFLCSKSDVTVLLLLVALFTCSIIALVLCMSTLFAKAKVGVTFYTFAVMIPAVLFNYVTHVALSLRILLTLIWSPLTFVFAFQEMFAAEKYDKQGIHWSNVNQPVQGSGSSSGGISVLSSMVLLIVNTIMYMMLAIYFNRIVPGNGGRTKTCCYCLYDSALDATNNDTTRQDDNDDARAKGNVEPPEIGLKVGVSIQQLHKVFKSVGGVEVHAVNGLSLDMYDSQVTALLGHNGAGKTTTMSMLTGMLDVTSGDADVYGFSLSKDIDNIRKMVGICTQHNLLWEKMTVLEHLQLFGAIRGTPDSLIDQEAVDLATKVGLGTKLHAYAKALSGGMKRKLSVALALIGNPRVVFLDEPTAGMDPESRHDLWNLITDMKRGRTVVLTTHHMDEADLLGDRIAIMAHGKLQVSGSSIFLKRRFGVGYNLTVDTSVPKDVIHIVRKHVDDAIVNEVMDDLLSMSLKMSSQPLFPDMLDEIEQLQHVSSFGLEMPTLEEVFIRLSQAGDVVQGGAERRRKSSSSLLREREEEGTRGERGGKEGGKESKQASSSNRHRLPSAGVMAPTFFRQTKAMLEKRWKVGKRNPSIAFQQIFLPCFQLLFIFVVKFSVTSFLSSLQGPDSIDINVTTQLYDNSRMVNLFPLNLYVNDGKINSDSQRLISSLPIPTTGSSFTTSPFAKVTKGKDVEQTAYEFNENMLQLGNCFGGVHFDKNSAASSEHLAANVTFNSTFTSSPSLLTSWLDTSAYRLTMDNSAASFHASVVLFPPSAPAATATSIASLASIVLGYALGVMVASAFAYIPAIAVTAVVEERETHVLHQQMLSGASVAGYWCANLIYDLLFFLPVLVGSIIVIVVLQLPGISNDYLVTVIAMLLVFAIQALPLAYVISHMFTSSVTAQNMTRAFFTLTGILLTLAAYILLDHFTGFGLTLIQILFAVIPNAGLALSLQQLAKMGAICAQYKKHGVPCPNSNPWDTDQGAGLYLLSMVGWSVIFLLAVVYIEKKRLQPPSFQRNACPPPAPTQQEGGEGREGREGGGEDVDVAEERRKTLTASSSAAASSSSDVVRVERLRKVYPATKLSAEKVAVHDLCLKIQPGTCFGLLGPNGAGKTTTMSMLTGTTWSTQGTASVAGYSIHENIHDIYTHLGFCPQVGFFFFFFFFLNIKLLVFSTVSWFISNSHC